MSLYALRVQVANARRELNAAVRGCGLLAAEVIRRYHVRTLRDADMLPPKAKREFGRHAWEQFVQPPGKETEAALLDVADRVMPYLGDGWDGRAWVPGASLGALDLQAAAGAAAMLRHRLQISGDVVDEGECDDAGFRMIALRSQIAAMGDLTDSLREAA